MEDESKVCPICKEKKSNMVIDTCSSAYKYIIERIKADHPDWVENDGACPKCVEHYKDLGK